jgi:exopolysaccharide production protein ExoZ
MKQKLHSIQSLRGAASLLVILFHLSLAEKKLWPESNVHFFSFFEKVGFIGIDLFFVISGFIMVWISYEHLGNYKKIGEFLKKRFLRIYPTYWAMCLLVFLTVKLHWGINLSLQDISATEKIQELLLLPANYHGFVQVAWSLSFEMLFYFIFCALFLFKRKFAGLFLMSLGIDHFISSAI